MKLTNNLYFYPERGVFDCNTYVISGEPGIIIDPGNAAFLPRLVDGLRRDGIGPESIGIIANTHLHPDHYGANEAFKRLSGADIYIHPVQKKFRRSLFIEGARLFGDAPPEFEEDACLDDDRLTSGGVELELILAPGHSPESVCFYSRGDRALVCGDVVFDHNTGRVDLPGGSADELRESIGKLSQLDVAYLLPGHMDIVSGADKVAQNFAFIEANILRWL
jgi:hydroxyacylglutathione hydrolase